MGDENSSETRVRPVFRQLLERDGTGRDWLPALLRLANVNKEYGAALARNVRPLQAGQLTRRCYKGKYMLEGCFERCLPPSEALTFWLINNPKELKWPLESSRTGKRREYGAETQRWRSMLTGEDAAAVTEAQREAMRQLGDLGVLGSEGKWWMFEGQTEADCCLESDDLVLVIEGKRNESLSAKTHWLPQRNQLWRNVEAASVWARGRKYAVIVIGERQEEPNAATLEASYPHLSSAQRRFLAGHYLGCTTWQEVCAATEIDLDSLPHKTTDVPSETPCDEGQPI